MNNSLNLSPELSLRVRPSGCDDYTKNVLKQGTDLKMSLMEYTFDKAIEKKQEEQRRKEEVDEY